MKKQKFSIKLEVVLNTLLHRMQQHKMKCLRSDETLIITDLSQFDTIEDIIMNTVREVFQCKKVGKVCKVNQFNGRLYIRFKKKN